MVAFLHAQAGVKRIYLPTNGILFARRENAEKLAPFKDKLMLLLQFDGRSLQVGRVIGLEDALAPIGTRVPLLRAL